MENKKKALSLGTIIALIGIFVAVHFGIKPSIEIVSPTENVAKTDTLKVMVNYSLNCVPFLGLKTDAIFNGDDVVKLTKVRCYSNNTKGHEYNYFLPFNKIQNDIIKNPSGIIGTITVKNFLDHKTKSFELSFINETPEGSTIDCCPGFSVVSYKENGNEFVAKFNSRGSIEQICCKETEQLLNWNIFPRSPYWKVSNDTSLIIQKAIDWLKENKIVHYNGLINVNRG